MESVKGPERASFDLTSLIQAIDFFHRSVTLNMVIITITDYRDGSCKYVSPTFKELSGFDIGLFQEGGMNWLVNHIHPEDRSQFRVNFTEGFLFLLGLSNEQKLKCYFNLVCRLIHRKGHPLWIYLQCRPIALDENSKPLYSLNMITDLTNVITEEGRPCWAVLESQAVGVKPVFLGGSCGDNMQWLFGYAPSPFTPAEKKILKLLIKGLSGKQIADRLKISINTVNTHRKNVLKKARAASVTQAIGNALRHNWIQEE